MAISSATTKAAPQNRHMIADYLGVDGENYLMGLGFTSINETHGAQESSKTYVNEKTATTWLTGYEREFSYENDLITSEKPVIALRDVGKRGLTGTDAMFDYYRVDLFDPKSKDDTNTSFYARHFIVTAVPDSEEGDGGAELTDSGTLKVVGDMEEGWFDVKAKTFTADIAAGNRTADTTTTTTTATTN